MTELKDMSKIFASVNDLLSKTNFETVTAEGTGFGELPDGYYLCEVEEANLGETQQGVPKAFLKIKIIEDGFAPIETGWKENKGTKGRLIWKHYPFKDERSIQNFASDMMKFEGDVAGESLLDRNYFTTAEVMEEALQLLIGLRIYVQLSTTERDGNKSQWTNLISWKRVAALELPM